MSLLDEIIDRVCRTQGGCTHQAPGGLEGRHITKRQQYLVRISRDPHR